MSTLGWVVCGLLGVTLAVTLVGLAGTRARLGRAEQRLADVDARLGELDARAERAVRAAQGAAALGPPGRRRRAARDPAPRVLLEPVTGPLVKAVAWSAGARRAATRLARSVRSDPR